jgi:hypothetical protein
VRDPTLLDERRVPMMPYRQPSPRTLDVHPDPAGFGKMMLQAGALFLVIGPLFLAWGIASWNSGGTGRFGEIFGSACFLLGGFGFLWMGYRTSGRFVRVSIMDGVVTLDWRRRSRVLKTERVALSDIVEVVVTTAPSSGVNTYGLAIGMRSGEIGLNSLVHATNVPAEVQRYVGECTRLAQFLGVPARTPS